MILNKREFFSWCARHGLTETADIVSVIPVSGQTIRNWLNRLKDEDELKEWVYFATRFYDDQVGPDADLRGYREAYLVEHDLPDPRLSATAEDQEEEGFDFFLPATKVPELKDWQHKYGFKTYKATGDVFGITRQAVHNWFKRDKFPRWLSIACAGYDLSIQSKTKVGRNKAA